MANPKKRIRWSESDAQAFFEAHAQSGRSLAKFAAERGVTHSKAYQWQQKLRSIADSGNAGFVAVRLTGHPSAAATYDAAIEIALNNGRVVRVRGDVDENVLRRVLAIAEGAR